MDSIDHGKQVLSAILHDRKDLLEIALRQLTLSHFADPQQRTIFQMCERYLDMAGLVINRGVIGDAFRGQPPGVAMQYQEYYDALMAVQPDGTFEYHLGQLRELAAERMTGEALAQSMEILTRGAMDGSERVQGHEAAREHALAKFGEIDRELHLQEAPEGDMRAETSDILEEYRQRAENRRTGTGSIALGIPELDEAIGGGMQPGELGLIAGDTNVGKTSLACQIAWHAVTQQGRNVVIFTSETNRTQVRFKIIARHSRWLASRAGAPVIMRRGINTKDLRAGSLSTEAEDFLRTTVRQFAEYPKHGRCYVAQVPRGATIGTIESRLARISRMFPVDVLIIDSLYLLRSDRKRQSKREELSEIIVDANQLATTYGHGRGLVLLSPWQMNREGNKNARDRGYYLTSDLAETAESSCTADLILSMLLPAGVEDTSHGREVQVKLGTPKVREGERLDREGIMLLADYACSYFVPQNGSGGTSTQDPLAGLDLGGVAPV